jgi:hypothetical protein
VEVAMIKRTILFSIILVVFCAAPVHAKIIGMRAGVRFGLIACDYDHDDGGDVSTGTGTHLGLGMGTDLFDIVGLDLTPQYRSLKYTRDEGLYNKTCYYDNIYFPVFLSLRGNFIPVVSPYIGLGVGFNIIVGGHLRSEFSDGNVVETSLDSGISIMGTEGTVRGNIIMGGGLEIKLSKLRIIPEFTANMSGSGDESNPPLTRESNYHISIGIYYAP